MIKKSILFSLTILFSLAILLNTAPIVLAATENGTATMTLVPGTSTPPTGSATSIQLNINTGVLSATGFQIVADFTGTVPADLTFTPIPPPEFSASYNQLIDITGGKRLQVIIDTGSTSGYSTNGSEVALGTLTFTTPTSGVMTITFDQIQTAILDSNFTDILHTVTNATYTFAPGTSPSPNGTSLVFAMKFEGVDANLGAKTVKVVTTSGTTIVQARDVTVTADANGLYSNSSDPLTELTPGTYAFYLNGPVHLTRRFTQLINAGTNNVSWELNYLLAGDSIDERIDSDIPTIADVIDIYDYNKVVEVFNCKVGNPPPPGKDQAMCDMYMEADYDFDGDVDIYDYNFLVGNFNISGEIN